MLPHTQRNTLLSNHQPPNLSHQKTPKLNADRGAEEPVGEEQLILGVTRLRRDAQVKEADPSLQLAGEVHSLCS